MIGRALHLWDKYGNGNLIIEGDSVNNVICASGRKHIPWRLIHIRRDIRKVCRTKMVHFNYVKCSANSVTEFLAKVGVEKHGVVVEFV